MPWSFVAAALPVVAVPVLALVAQKGMNALTMTALAREAGVGKPVVYAHFDNRDQVAVALLYEHFSLLHSFVWKRLSGASSVKEYIFLLVDALFDFEKG